jgi:hypothetical protein
MSHALTIRANGQTIGLIQNFSPAPQVRPAAYVYELNTATSGEPVERAPGNLSGLEVTVDRYDLYTLKMETAFGTADFSMLTDQTDKFQVREVWQNPDGSTESYIYLECIFTNLGRKFMATGDRIVMCNATLAYLKKVQST